MASHTSIATSANTPIPGRTLRASMTSTTNTAASPSSPALDFVKRTVAIIIAAIAAAMRRGSDRPREIAIITASGTNVTMFVARSFGLPISPEIDPCSRSPLIRLVPLAKSRTPRAAT